jgi:hypothetical protein
MNMSKRTWGRLAVLLYLAMPLAAQAAQDVPVKEENPDEVLTAAKLPTQLWHKTAYSQGDSWTVNGFQTPALSKSGICVGDWTVWQFHYVRGSGTAKITKQRSGKIARFTALAKGGLGCETVDLKQYSDIEDQDPDVIAAWMEDLRTTAVDCIKQNKYENCGHWKSIDMVFVNVEPSKELETKYHQNFATLPQRRLDMAYGRDQGEIGINFLPVGKTDSGVYCDVKRLKDGSETLEYGVY